MPRILDESTSTSATDPITLAPGEYKIALTTSDGSVSIAVEEREEGLDWRTVAKGGTAVALTSTDPAITYKSSGEQVRVTRTGGSAAATVTARPVEPN